MHTPGPMPAHCSSRVQGTQVLVAPSQTGLVATGQPSLLTHSTQRPEVGSQAGVAPAQPASTDAHETQVWSAEQMGAVPWHCALVLQPTQRLPTQ
jgi:hypothetical protein